MGHGKGSMRIGPVLLTTALLFFCLFGYQNCTGGGGLTQSSRESSLSSSSTTQEHPYEFNVDTLAYSSCTYDAERDSKYLLDHGYFTFKVGGYLPESGLRIDPTFISKFRSPTPKVITDQLLKISQGKESDVVLSMRARNNLRYTVAPQNPVLGSHFGATQFRMGRPTLVGQLSELLSGDYLRLVKYRDANDRVEFLDSAVKPFAAQFVLNGDGSGSNEGHHSDFRRSLGDENLLTMAFSQGIDDTGLLNVKYPASAPDNSLMGKGFNLQFAKPSGEGPDNIIYPGDPTPDLNRAISGISEVDLSNAAAPRKAWKQCFPPLKIVQWVDALAEDRPELGLVNIVSPCPLVSDQDSVLDNGLINTQKAERLAILRRVLPVQNWYINLAKNCVVPKQMNRDGDRCYNRALNIPMTNTVFREVAYLKGERCTTSYNNSISNRNLPLCPHFISVCVKN